MFRKRISVLSLVLAVVIAVSVFSCAAADEGANDGIYGTTQGAASFTIRAYEAGAFVKLGSYEGTASINPQTGMVMNSSIKQNISMTISEQGLSIPMTMVGTTTVEVK